MKISTQEGYGLRILLTIASDDNNDGWTIAQISESEDLSVHTVAKMLRLLRINGFVQSTRGQAGGYVLAKPADQIMLSKVLSSLGGRLFDESVGEDIDVLDKLCTDSVDCSIRSLWRILQLSIDKVLMGLSLKDLIGPRNEFRQLVVERIYDSNHPLRTGCQNIILKNLEVSKATTENLN